MTARESWPFARPGGRTFELAPQYSQLREADPVSRIILPDGTPAWLAISSHDVRTVLTDPRFSTRIQPMHRPGGDTTERIGALAHLDPPDHATYREPLQRLFSARRVRALEPRISQVIDEHLEMMAAAGPPADLVAAFAIPVPLTITCELIGLPLAERAMLQEAADLLLTLDVDPQNASDTATALLDYLNHVVRIKHSTPGDDLISHMVGHGRYTDAEVAALAATVLLGGYETLAGMISTGAALLMHHPAQALALQGDVHDRTLAVEEILRYVTVIQYGCDRIALTDLFLGDQLIHAGDRVVAFLPAANRDPLLCPVPDVLNTQRPPTAHAAFGYGPHQCLGQQLARVELGLALHLLFQRFPRLKLADAQNDLPTRRDKLFASYHHLPVTW
ncbi:cytochrome P450 [Kitasatospora purpeofusca]|uniref:cytochrome P450 n=1 Tax=Kitasatospora purpeofusca TaxID=67352 RepID=UPI003688AF36